MMRSFMKFQTCIHAFMYACMNASIFAWVDACTACVHLIMKWRILKTKLTCFTNVLKLFQSRMTCAYMLQTCVWTFFRCVGNRFFDSSYGFALQLPVTQRPFGFFIFEFFPSFVFHSCLLTFKFKRIRFGKVCVLSFCKVVSFR